MGRAHHDLERPTPLGNDPHSSSVDEENFSVLDEGILEVTTPAMSPTVERARESFADAGAPFSRSENTWSTYSYATEPVALHQQANHTHGFVAHGGSAFANPSSSMSMQYAQPTAWSLNGASGSCTPTAEYDHLVPEFENGRGTTYTMGPASHLAQADAYGALQLQTASSFPPNAAFAGSPQSGKDWMSASSSDGIDLRSAGPHISPHSPTFAANTLLLRRDGIRKKNARFEIPAERNLRTIDLLINQTSDEQEIKELKQQKRLLRNRQAA
jgi:hypothetical protein